MRCLITVSYDGSKYYGFQRLNDMNSVQKELEDALSIISKKRIIVKGSGRTDRGVHAISQKCHFDIDVNISPNLLVMAINSLLSSYIHVLDCKIVSDDFHSRFNVKKKIYEYKINMGKYDAIFNDYVYNYLHKLDIKSMKKASLYLIGKHSYHNFVSGVRDNYDGEIFDIKFSVKDDILTIRFVGKSFYRYMVRNIVGSLILVGENKIKYNDYERFITNKDKPYTYITVPSNGLYLVDVIY